MYWIQLKKPFQTLPEKNRFAFKIKRAVAAIATALSLIAKSLISYPK